jgi:yersiniabactin nonribosomal peptide/polyketide synthase
LFSIGANSIHINQIKSAIEDAFQVHISNERIYQNPTVSSLIDLYANSKKKKKKLNILPNLIQSDPSSKYDSFETTEIQQAYLFGRIGYAELGHVSCFAYQEYDYSSDFDVDRLETAFNHLIQRHETLRIIFPSETEQKIRKSTTTTITSTSTC